MRAMKIKTVDGDEAGFWARILRVIDGAVILCCFEKNVFFPVEGLVCRGRFNEVVAFNSCLLSNGRRCRVSINFRTGKGGLALR